MGPRAIKRKSSDEDDFVIPFHTHAAERPPAKPRARAPGRVVRLSFYRKIAASFLVVALLLLAFVVYISFTRALVVITPKTEKSSTDVNLTIAAEPKGDLAITGYILETVIDGVKTVAVSSGTAKTVTGNSCGNVTLINNQNRAQPLVATTRLLSKDGVLFRLTKTINVPANGTLVAPACADQPGSTGDIGPTTFVIPGLSEELQKKTYAESKSAMVGGVKTLAVVDEAQVAKAVDDFTIELAAQGIAKMKALVPSPEARNGSFVSSNLVKKETDAKPGTEQSSFNLNLSVHVVGVFYDPMALAQAAGAALRSSVGADRQLLSIDPASLTAELVKADPAAKRADVKVKLQGASVVSDGSVLIDKGRIAGLSPKDAEAYLKIQPFVESVEIRLSPAWARSIPKLKDHIDIVIKQPSK